LSESILEQDAYAWDAFVSCRAFEGLDSRPFDFVVANLDAAAQRATAAGAVLENGFETQEWSRTANSEDGFGHGVWTNPLPSAIPPCQAT